MYDNYFDENEFKRYFKKALTKAMRKSGLTREDLADILGVSKHTIDRYFCGERMPTIATVMKISGALGYSPIVFLNPDEYGNI